MATIAVIENDVIINVIIADNAEIASELTEKECIDISEPINLELLNGTIMPAWLGIDWKRENNKWVPPFDIDIPLELNTIVDVLNNETSIVTDEVLSTKELSE